MKTVEDVARTIEESATPPAIADIHRRAGQRTARRRVVRSAAAGTLVTGCIAIGAAVLSEAPTDSVVTASPEPGVAVEADSGESDDGESGAFTSAGPTADTTEELPRSESCSNRGAGRVSALGADDDPGAYETIAEAVESLRAENGYRVPDFLDVEWLVTAPVVQREHQAVLRLEGSDGDLQFSMTMALRDVDGSGPLPPRWFIDDSLYCVPSE